VPKPVRRKAFIVLHKLLSGLGWELSDAEDEVVAGGIGEVLLDAEVPFRRLNGGMFGGSNHAATVRIYCANAVGQGAIGGCGWR
jgi:hypothetical protein